MTTSEQTYSLLANSPIRVANSNPALYYWRGVALTEPMLLTLVGSILFRIPVSPEMRIIAGRSQRLAILDRLIDDSVSIEQDHYRSQDIDQVYYHGYSAALRNHLHECDMSQYSVETILNWVRPQEMT